jgi:hypothetical protein
LREDLTSSIADESAELPSELMETCAKVRFRKIKKTAENTIKLLIGFIAIVFTD